MRPLEGIKVLDMTIFLSGPMATAILAGLGAEVIKVEPPGGDGTRHSPPLAGPKGVDVAKQTPDDLSFHFLRRNRNKKSIVLNLKDPSGRETLLRLAKQSDILAENFRPGTMDRLGVGYEVLRKVNPGLIWCSISGFGQTGRYASMAALDIVIQAMSGLMSLNGEEGGPPLKAPVMVGDLASSLWAAIGILAALKQRDRTGQGQMVDVSMLESLMALLMDESFDFWSERGFPARMGNRLPRLTPFTCYPNSDGHMVIAVASDAHWQKILETIGRHDLLGDPRYLKEVDRTVRADEVDEIMLPWTRSVTTAEAVQAMAAIGVPAAPVRDFREAFRDPALEERGFILPLEHPTAGKVGDYRAWNLPIKFSDAEAGLDRPAPLLGQHTEEILASLEE